MKHLDPKFYELKKTLPVTFLYSTKKEVCVVVSFSCVNFTLKVLKLHINYQYKVLSSISGVDLVGRKSRFCVVYDLLSFKNNSRLRVKTFVNETSHIFSATCVFINADWWEREIWDLFGIYFENHVDLRRLLTDYGDIGYPLRKDYPLSGYVELQYCWSKKGVVCQPLQHSQEYRVFLFEERWH